jgi:hypothetical protein
MKIEIKDLVVSLVVGVGFAGGFWLALGFDPVAVILQITTQAGKEATGMNLSWVSLIPTAISIFSVVIAGIVWGWLAILSVILGFLGGLVIISKPLIGFPLVIAGLALGHFVMKD